NATDSTTAFQIQDAAGTSNLLIADTTNTEIGIGKAPTLGALDVNGSIYQSGNQVCDMSGNCIGAGGGAVGGSGTAGTIAVFTGSGFTIGNSLLSQSGGTVTANGNFNITTGNQYQINGSQISSANLSNDSNLAKLNGTGPQTFTGNNKFTGTVLAENSSNSTNAFQVQNQTGGSLLNVDSTNSNITLAGNNSGEVSVWQTAVNALPIKRDSHTSVVANGYVYVFGGWNGTAYTSTVYYAKLNDDGSVG